MKKSAVEDITVPAEQSLIVVRQLPVFEDNLRAVRPLVEQMVADATALPATEENLAEVKRNLAALRKKQTEVKAALRDIKLAVLEPYERLQSVAQENALDPLQKGIDCLSMDVSQTEATLLQRKVDTLTAWYSEYHDSLGLTADLAPFESSGIKVIRSASDKSLITAAKEFLDRVADDMKVITSSDDAAELLAIYRRCYDLSGSLLALQDRRSKEAEAAREAAALRARQEAMREAETVSAVEEALAEAAAPTEADWVEEAAEEPAPEESETYTATFTVYGDLDQLKALVNFMRERNIEYEQQQ